MQYYNIIFPITLAIYILVEVAWSYEQSKYCHIMS